MARKQRGPTSVRPNVHWPAYAGRLESLLNHCLDLLEVDDADWIKKEMTKAKEELKIGEGYK